MNEFKDAPIPRKVTYYADLPTLDEVERNTIISRIEECENNKSWAARSLGITLKTLYNRLEAYRNADLLDTRPVVPAKPPPAKPEPVVLLPGCRIEDSL